MGDSISEGTVAAVLKKAGEPVAMDEVVAQIETDKVTIDVRSPVGGAVTDVLVKEQDTVVVGQAVVRVEEGAAGMEPLLGGAAKANEGGGGGARGRGARGRARCGRARCGPQARACTPCRRPPQARPCTSCRSPRSPPCRSPRPKRQGRPAPRAPRQDDAPAPARG